VGLSVGLLRGNGTCPVLPRRWNAASLIGGPDGPVGRVPCGALCLRAAWGGAGMKVMRGVCGNATERYPIAHEDLTSTGG
jgi:hypothetical protein